MKDKVNIPTSSFPRLSASDGQLSPSSVSLSASEQSPSSPLTTVSEDLHGSPGAGNEPTSRQANRPRGQQNQRHTGSPSRKPSRGDSKPASPMKAGEGAAKRSPSPRKAERGHRGSKEDMRERRSSSPRKSPKNQAEPPPSPRRPAGQQPSAALHERRSKDEERSLQQEAAPDSGGAGDSHRKNRRAEQEASGQRAPPTVQAHRERAASESHGLAGETSGRDARGSSSSVQEPGCNGTSRKAAITPGPWKVPSSAKMQAETTFADV